MNNTDLIELIRDISDHVGCLEELVNPLIATAFELRLDALLKEPAPAPGIWLDWGAKDNAHEWMIAHYNQISGVLFAMMLILQQTVEMVERAEVEACGLVKDGVA